LKKFALYTALAVILFCGCAGTPADAQVKAPAWVENLEKAFPSKDWVAVVGQGANQPQAEAAAMNSLARAFKTDIEGITNASLRFGQIVEAAAKSKVIDFSESKNYLQEVNITSNVRGLIGVQIDLFRAADSTVYVNARMNRRECSARYAGMIKENSAIIDKLLTAAALFPDRASFDVYSRLSFAYAIAQVTDNFQHILEVLDPTAVNRKPAYGGANNIRTKMLDCGSLITIVVSVDTELAADKPLLTRAIGSFFRDLGFKTSESNSLPAASRGNYLLLMNARFETISQNVISCRYYLDAALEDSNKKAIFSFTEDDRKAHPNTASEARRLAVRAAETSLKEGKFAMEFEAWLNSLLD